MFGEWRSKPLIGDLKIKMPVKVSA